jgi:hypothetical protein
VAKKLTGDRHASSIIWEDNSDVAGLKDFKECNIKERCHLWNILIVVKGLEGVQIKMVGEREKKGVWGSINSIDSSRGENEENDNIVIEMI